MSSISTLMSTASDLMVYIGLFLLITGLVGNVLNVIIFLSLKTFRQTSAVVYLVVASFVNTGQLLAGLVSRIMFNALLTDWTLISPFYCKFRAYLVHFCAFSSLTCVSLAVIDQFLATSTRPHWQQWSNITIASYMSGISLIFWIFYLCPHLIYYNLVVSSEGDQSNCTITNFIYSKYVDDFVVPVLWFLLPFFISALFGLLTYRNIKHIAYRTVPLLRRRVDEQLSVMILVQVIFNIFITLSYIIFLTIMSHVSFSTDSLTTAQILLIKNITICLYYLYPASPFYIYIGASERFRRQLHYVLNGIYFNRCNQRRVHVIDQRLPQAKESRPDET